MTPKGLDVIYVTASARDGRFTRICVASIRRLYPDTPIRVLAGGLLEQGLADELARYWDAPLADVRPGEWGWGFVKLEPLFGRAGERFLVLDSDTALTGPILDVWSGCEADFLVDDEPQTETDTHRLYYDWRKAGAIDRAAKPPQFVFNSGQWFGTAGLLTRRDFERFLDWSAMPPRLRHPDIFMNGDQGILNYVLNQKSALNELHVERAKIMHWPGHGMHGFTTEAVASGNAPPRIIHWAGYKRSRLGALPGADILRFFERFYYSRLPAGGWQRTAARIHYPIDFWRRNLTLRINARVNIK